MRRLSAILFAVALGVGTASADDIEGVYKGTIWSGDDYPGTTIFTISAMGQISGTYIFEADTGPAAGELTECVIEVRLLRCTWSDEYGAGDFMALFSPDFRSFDGGWFEDQIKGIRPSLDGAYRWTGKRTE